MTEQGETWEIVGESYMGTTRIQKGHQAYFVGSGSAGSLTVYLNALEARLAAAEGVIRKAECKHDEHDWWPLVDYIAEDDSYLETPRRTNWSQCQNCGATRGARGAIGLGFWHNRARDYLYALTPKQEGSK